MTIILKVVAVANPSATIAMAMDILRVNARRVEVEAVVDVAEEAADAMTVEAEGAVVANVSRKCSKFSKQYSPF
jgi:hypothetical protein